MGNGNADNELFARWYIWRDTVISDRPSYHTGIAGDIMPLLPQSPLPYITLPTALPHVEGIRVERHLAARQ